MGPIRIVHPVVFLCFFGVTVFSQIDVEEDVNKLSKANAYFATKLYKELSTDTKKNLIFSPFSISAALSMLKIGADGATSKELNDTLGFAFAQMNEQELLKAYQNVVRRLTEEQNGYQFSLANAQFLQKSYHVYPNYSRILAEDFEALTSEVDFKKKKEALGQINGWVRKATKGKITSILEDVSPSSVMALVNAVFFKGDWLEKFDIKDTTDGFFKPEDGPQKPVKMMSKKLLVKRGFISDIEAMVLELPYANRIFSVFFLLPRRGKPLADLGKTMTPETLLQISNELDSERQEIVLPRIKIQSEIDMISSLQAIGIKDVFTDFANLSRLSQSPLKVGQARHKATMEFNEEGSEASASTAIVPVPRTGGIWLNRPFMFLLRHNPTNTICFMGKVSDV